MAEYLFPSNKQLTQIAQEKVPVLTQDDPIFDIMPIVDQDAALLIWEQLDNYVGMQQVRGVGGAPSKVPKTGAKQYTMQPGRYGEFELIDELELELMRQLGDFSKPIDVKTLVMRAQDKLLNRRIDRIRYIGWKLISEGTFSVSDADGTVLHTDTFPIQTFTAGVSWGTSATATPLANFRSVALLARGKGTSFGSKAKAYMNQTTFNKMISNTNAADIAGRRTSGLVTVLNLQEVNAVLAGEGLPTIVIYDEVYITDAGTTTLHLADDKVVVVGSRPAGQTVAEYRMTRNANNAGMAPGAYMKTIDRGEDTVPRRIEVHDGHNGGPVIFFPGSIVRMSV